ncbi:MAG TPA: heparan-alpha-glucosaminide N-acetyltransferase domain-containing protein [Myxococcota bacterium]|nr:heparan-alpha-glucosaminide N-acetyltransferase domain-containing protein [Myxococcota bacterium]
MKRDIGIDIVRTVAIIIMIGANLGSLLPSPHALWFRYYSSMAAPLFVTLAGMMVAYSVQGHHESAKLSYFLKRGAFLILCGAFIDSAIFGEIPFVSMDVLYVIGLGLPFAFLATKQSQKIDVVLVFILALVAAALQKISGYSAEPLALTIGEPIELSFGLGRRILSMWFVDGWFPVFPWLAYLIFGVILAKLRWLPSGRASFAEVKFLVFAGFLVILGAWLMYVFPAPSFEREGYAELFYPPTIPFIIWSFGIVILACSMADLSEALAFWRIIIPLGQASLFVYICHIALIQLVKRYLNPLSVDQYLLIYGSLVVGLLLSALLLRVLKRRSKAMPDVLRWLLGS